MGMERVLNFALSSLLLADLVSMFGEGLAALI